MKITFIEGTDGKNVCGDTVTLQVLAECGGVKRVVQGFTDKASRDEIAKALFADIIEAGAPVAKVKPEYDSKWSKEIDAVKAVAEIK